MFMYTLYFYIVSKVTNISMSTLEGLRTQDYMFLLTGFVYNKSGLYIQVVSNLLCLSALMSSVFIFVHAWRNFASPKHTATHSVDASNWLLDLELHLRLKTLD